MTVEGAKSAGHDWISVVGWRQERCGRLRLTGQGWEKLRVESEGNFGDSPLKLLLFLSENVSFRNVIHLGWLCGWLCGGGSL